MGSSASKPDNFKRLYTTHENGKPRSELHYRDGWLEQSTIWYYQGGKAEEFRCSQLTKECDHVKWLPNGKKFSESNYDADGKLHGRQMWFHDNGEMRRQEEYFHGQKHGVDQSWDEDGKTLRQDTWCFGFK